MSLVQQTFPSLLTSMLNTHVTNTILCVCVRACDYVFVNVSLRALIRAGRFDTRINTTLPDVRARHKILEVHASKVKLHEGMQIL